MATMNGKSWPNTFNDYDLQEVIGYGATAVVQAALCKPRNERVAVKRIDLEKCGASIDEMQKEIAAMSQCNHENVVNYYTSFIVKQELWIVMRLLDGGSMLDVIRYQIKLGRNQGGVLDETIIATVLKEVLKGLDYFHSNGLIHRDVKAGNILLATDGTVQVADFGVSSALYSYGDRSRPEKRTTFVGTPCWMAPEVMEQVNAYNNKADIWSFGITAIELATGTAPYAKFPAMKVLMLTLQNDPPTLETISENKNDDYKKYSRQFRRMISLCLNKDPQQRPDASELLKNAFFKRAKGKAFLKETLLPLAPPLGERSQKVKRVPGSSGRLHKNSDGLWEWSDDESYGGPGNENENKIDAPNDNKGEQTPVTSMTSDQSDQVTTPATQACVVSKPSNEETSSSDKPVLNLTLRLRNAKNELNDIRFDFKHGEDTPQGVAQELVSAGLINGVDMILVAANLEKALENPALYHHPEFMVFQLKTSIPVGIMKDEKSLIGFAQLTIN
ncbi:STE20/SPS1-related proline-alanine-rich protein kinase-like [Xenia sp. Carnegie-2017]|uniref:STE20/SPS1-related proline-alanine-rich protein kinase-like n=1 Tax=Xenia sp. Carnegie-2017 TaxID=2897299 RepID=UPI001F04AB6B|nr:STE20/SPS1-related proline-alanine-rich protein kinase-like [Xenia sp. Carnegie-2017]